MGILRTSPNPGGSGGKSSLFVKCPKCRANMAINVPNASAPIRCPECNYPMIRKSDLMRIVDACEQLKSGDAAQANTACTLLNRMSAFLPEAAVALNRVAGKMPFVSVAESARFNSLVHAYARGSAQAREALDNMCLVSPDMYSVQVCKSCGARVYTDKTSHGKSLCAFCHSAP